MFRHLTAALVAVFSGLTVAVEPSTAAECGPLQSFATVDTVSGPNGMMLVPVRINDLPRFLLLDTGGGLSGISAAMAKELKLAIYESRTTLRGVSGAASDRYTVVPSLAIGRLVLKSKKFLILPGGGAVLGDDRVAGVLAPNPTLDLDLDFAGKRLRFVSPDHCPGHVVYWPAEAAAAVPMRIAQIGHIVVPVTLDGKRMDAVLDTGAVRTALNLGAAKTRFGIDTNSPGVSEAGEIAGASGVKVYRRQFSTLAFEGVVVNNPLIALLPDRITQRLLPATGIDNRIRQSDAGLPDLLLGMDVLSKLHVYVAYNERKVYVTPASPAP
jgi:predicted aspartyl protease